MRAKSRGAGRRAWRRELETGKPLISARRGARSIMGAIIAGQYKTPLDWTRWRLAATPGAMEFSDEAAHELQACDAAGVPAVGFALLSMASRSSAKIASFCTAGGHGRGRCRPARWRYGGPARRVARPIADNARRSPTAAAPARRRSSRLSDPPHRRRRRDKARRSMDPAASRENSGGGRNPWPFPKSVKMGRNRSRNDRKRGAFVVDLSCPRLLRRRHASSLCHATSGPARSMRPSESVIRILIRPE